MNRLISVIFSFLVFGCATGPMEGSHDPVKIRTETRGPVFLTPPQKGKNHVLIKVSDAAGPIDLNLSERLANGLIEKGYQIVAYPDQADYLLQGTVVQAGEVAPEVLQALYRSRVGTRLAVAEVKETDVIARTLGLLSKGTRTKSYAIVVDLRITEIKADGYARKTARRSKTRVVSGVAGCPLPFEAITPHLCRDISRHGVAMF